MQNINEKEKDILLTLFINRVIVKWESRAILSIGCPDSVIAWQKATDTWTKEDMLTMDAFLHSKDEINYKALCPYIRVCLYQEKPVIMELKPLDETTKEKGINIIQVFDLTLNEFLLLQNMYFGKYLKR